MISIYGTEHGTRGREGTINVDEECLVVSQFDAFSDEAQELGNGQITGHQVLVLVDLGKGCVGGATASTDLGGPFDNDGDLIWVDVSDLVELV